MVEYYQQNYGITIQDVSQPLLVSKPKKRDIRARGGDDSPIFLVPELCTRTGLSEEARADFRLMKDVAIYTRVSPDSRMKSLQMFMGDLQKKEPKEILDGWNLVFDKEAVRISGRVLPPEVIYHSSKVKYSYNPATADWSKELRGQHLLSTINMEDYMILFTGRDRNSAREFIEALQKVGPPMGFNVGKPNTVQLDNDRTDNFLRGIKTNLRDSTQMVIVVLPSNRKDRYDSIKKLCCVESPVPSQCILQDPQQEAEPHERGHQSGHAAQLQARRRAVGPGSANKEPDGGGH